MAGKTKLSYRLFVYYWSRLDRNILYADGAFKLANVEGPNGLTYPVKNARRLETHFHSPQLDLWQLSDTEWLLALRRPEPLLLDCVVHLFLTDLQE